MHHFLNTTHLVVVFTESLLDISLCMSVSLSLAEFFTLYTFYSVLLFLIIVLYNDKITNGNESYKMCLFQRELQRSYRLCDLIAKWHILNESYLI